MKTLYMLISKDIFYKNENHYPQNCWFTIDEKDNWISNLNGTEPPDVEKNKIAINLIQNQRRWSKFNDNLTL
jgi:hypothetical protein